VEAVRRSDAALESSYYLFDAEHIVFLREFQKDLDINRAANACGIEPRKIHRHLKKKDERGKALKRELMRIQDEHVRALHLNTQSAAAEHMRLQRKFESDYDSADDERAKASYAGVLARMSDSNLKATNHYLGEGVDKGIKVNINIDLGEQVVSGNTEDVIDVEVGEE